MSIYNTIKMQMKFAMNMFESEKGEAGLIKLLIGLFIVAILAGALLPTGINAIIAGKNESGTWTSAESSTYGAIVILLIIVVVAALAGMAYKALD